VVWEDSRFSGGAHNDVALSKSTDGGRTWSTPVRVNQSPLGVTAFTPGVDVLPDGTVGITYYDLRFNTAAPGLPTDYFFVSSTTGGATWQPELRLSPTSFDDELAPVARGYFLGDYQGLAHDATSFKSMFTQTNTGNTNNRTDAFAHRRCLSKVTDAPTSTSGLFVGLAETRSARLAADSTGPDALAGIARSGRPDRLHHLGYRASDTARRTIVSHSRP
jgi:hypothetical protein